MTKIKIKQLVLRLGGMWGRQEKFYDDKGNIIKSYCRIFNQRHRFVGHLANILVNKNNCEYYEKTIYIVKTNESIAIEDVTPELIESIILGG